MSSYWRNEDKIKVSQTKVSIPSTNGQSYSGTAGSGGRRVDFEIPPSVKFIDGQNSYLQFDVKLAVGAVPTRLQLDPFIGGQVLVKNIRAYSSAGVLLEECVDYNCKVQMEYSYNQDESLRKMRALKEGSLVSTIANRGTEGTSESNLIDTNTNPYYKPVPVVPATRNWGTSDDFLTAKVSLPIHIGLFAQNTKVFPNMIVGGIRLEVDLEDCARCVKQLDSVNRHRRMKQNPLFHGIDQGGSAFSQGATNRLEIFLSKSNNMLRVEDCPFVKGEAIGICSKSNPNEQANLTKADGTSYHPIISDISMGAGDFVKLTLAENTRNSAVGTGVDITKDDFIIYSAAMDTKRVQVDDKTTVLIAATTAYDAKYEVSNMEIVCAQVDLDDRFENGMVQKMKDGGSIELDLHSTMNIKQSLLKSNRNATLNLEAGLTRVKSVIVIPTDAEVYNTAQLIGGLGVSYDEEQIAATDGRLHSIRTGQVGIIDKLTSYQFLVDDKLVPSRPIEVGKINGGVSISAQPLMQTEQALNQAKIIPRSFVDYNRNFVIGRAFALNDGVANINNKSLQLQLLYNQSTAAGVDQAPKHNKLMMAMMYYVKRISVKGDSVVVQN